MIPITNITGRLGNQMFQFAYIYSQFKKGFIIDTYVQSTEYFMGCEHEIKNIFGRGITPINQVAIHVRRGKNPMNPYEPAYYENPFYINLSNTDYYEKAMSLFPDADFLVFSDDIEWCKAQSIFKDCEFSEGNDEVTDLNLMAGCEGLIMANSSYSWWAGFLSSGRVVAPLEWHPDGVERTKLLDSWEKI